MKNNEIVSLLDSDQKIVLCEFSVAEIERVCENSGKAVQTIPAEQFCNNYFTAVANKENFNEKFSERENLIIANAQFLTGKDTVQKAIVALAEKIKGKIILQTESDLTPLNFEKELSKLLD